MLIFFSTFISPRLIFSSAPLKLFCRMLLKIFFFSYYIYISYYVFLSFKLSAINSKFVLLKMDVMKDTTKWLGVKPMNPHAKTQWQRQYWLLDPDPRHRGPLMKFRWYSDEVDVKKCLLRLDQDFQKDSSDISLLGYNTNRTY